MDAELTLRFSNTSLDPYLRFFEPQLSPFTNAVAGGTVRVVGELADVDHLARRRARRAARSEAVRLPRQLTREPATPGVARRDRADARSQHVVDIVQSPAVRRGHAARSSGNINLHESTIASTASGDANLGILQGVLPRHPQLRRGIAAGAGRRPLDEAGVLRGARRSPTDASASFAAAFARGDQRPDRRSTPAASASTACARGLPSGDVTFGGRVGLNGFSPARSNLTATGQQMRIRYPEGFRVEHRRRSGAARNAGVAAASAARSPSTTRSIRSASSRTRISSAWPVRAARRWPARRSDPTLPLRVRRADRRAFGAARREQPRADGGERGPAAAAAPTIGRCCSAARKSSAATSSSRATAIW